MTTFHINTIVIGLELVARGGKKPDELNIRWKEPSNRRESADQARQFVLLAIIESIVSSFDALLRDYADLKWLTLPPNVIDILRKAITGSDHKEYSIAKRAEELLLYLKLDESESLAMLELMVSWRNALVHSERAKPRLQADAERQMKLSAARFADRYANIDVLRMLESFAARHRPSLKEATTMIAISQNLARSLDQAYLRLAGGTPEQVRRIALLELAQSSEQKKSQWNQLYGRDTEARVRALNGFLAEVGIADVSEGVTAGLESDFVHVLASLTKAEMEARLAAYRASRRP
jgi:hypothetical protein